MTHLEIAQGFNSFAYNYNSSDVAYINEETKNRVIISKLYYSLLHYYFEQFPAVALSTSGNKHDTILRKVQHERGQREYVLFVTLKKLRVWADYKTLNTMPTEYRPAHLFHQVNSIVNRH